MAEIILIIILMIPFYGLLIWSYLDPEESMLFGKRWMYKEEPEISDEAIRYTKFASMTVMIGLPIILISFILDIPFLKFSMVIIPLVLAIGAFKIFTDEKDS
ncbi:hypothetical protein V7122_22805 [Bacillus sp. JJ1532]|uniref:hypothetical protein n=1 Tax=unclassified Bacillus (in: firmicutes) TaxID=185979 RepID=UPI002FFFAFF5